MKVLFHYDVGPAFAAHSEALGEQGIEVSSCPQGDEERFRRLLADVDVLWHVLQPVSGKHIAGAPRLRLIQKIGVGVNTIDLDVAAAADVAVCNMPGTNSHAVMEMTLALTLATLRRLPLVDRLTREGAGWSFDPAFQDTFGEIGGRTVGLIGFGAVPSLLAPVLTSLGARVIYTAPSDKDVPYARVELDELIASSDIVSLHIPLTAETAQLINDERLRRMKPGAVLINTARGALVDEVALHAALVEGRLLAAGLDVLAEEPTPMDNPLLGLDNVVVAPHLAWLTPETFERSIGVAVENVKRLDAGEPLLHRVA